MYNWNTDTKELKKNPEKYTIWKLEQMINYGLDGEKIDKHQLVQFWPKLRNQIDPYKRRAIEYLLWGKLYLLPNNLSFWSASKKMSK
jgi:hypothetical protein